jgi:hypothetical protein
MKDEYQISQEVYLTRKEAARELRMSQGYLDKQRRLGRGPDFCRFGRSIRISRSSLNL